MTEPLRWLKHLDEHDLRPLGGKAAGLVRLARAGLPVPGGFVVPASLLEDLFGGGEAPTVPEDVAGAWVEAARSLGPRLAVRSSGAEEDGQTRSFAGVHRTELGVAPEEVPAAIARVWASRRAEVAVAYGGRAAGSGAMTVLVQPMVDAAVAGVLFTVNPTTGSWRELVVEAVWGLGEPLVSGQVAPHWFLLRRPRRLPWGLARAVNRVRLRVVDRSLPALETRLRATDRGAVSEPLPVDLVGLPTLDDPSLCALARLALRAEQALGEPLDLEWARLEDGRFLLLQARPITAARAADPTTTLWTRRFLGERWSEPATPMGWSLIEPVLSGFIAYPDTQARLLGGGPPLRLVEGWPYLNATVFRHLAFKLPGAPPPHFMLELLPPEEERSWRTRFAALPGLRVYASILAETARERRWERFAWNPLTNPQAWQAFVQASQPALERPPPGGTPRELISHVDRLQDLVRAYVGIHVCSLLFANLTWQLLEAGLAVAVPERASALLEALAVSPPGNRTLQTNEALWSLARLATVEDLAALEAGEPLRPDLQGALDAFLGRHGHRSVASWEVFSKRWREEPALLVPLLRAQRAAVAREPGLQAQQQEARYHEAVRELVRTVPGATGAWLLGLAWLLRRYLLLRENQRDWFDGLQERLAGVLTTAGGVLVDRGLLKEPGEVRWLTWEELRGMLVDEGSATPVRELVERRRLAHVRARSFEPPGFLNGDEAVLAPAGGPRLQGLGISRGRARGVVRRLDRPGDGARLGPGEVLVTRAVDPSWTPLFLTAGAVITELGGALSHGAVVAREYGVPMVVNLEGVTRHLRDGDEVTVDGGRGIVWVHR